MPVKQIWLWLLAVKFATQMGWVMVSAVGFPLVAADEGDLLAFFPALGFVFFGLAEVPFFVFIFTFFAAPVAAVLAAFFGVALDFFFCFFFKVLLLSSGHPMKSVNLTLKLLGPIPAESARNLRM
jgi:hypothetical protein